MSASCLPLLFSISSREIVSNVENTLEASVFGAFEDMEYEDGRWDFDSDLMNLEAVSYTHLTLPTTPYV